MIGRLPLAASTLVLLLAALILGACGGSGQAATPAAPPQQYRIEVLDTRPHDAAAFTEGLAVAGGRLFESTGLLGQSSVREVDPLTGQVIHQTTLGPDLFGEGLTAVGDNLIQLTWRSGIAFVWNRDDLTQKGLYSYQGEGWGLCYDPGGRRLVQSDGSDLLTFRDPNDFHVLGQVAVTRDGRPLGQINELECSEDGVWANIWRSNTIVRIDATSGRVTGSADATRLVPPGTGPDDVLNGIARLADGTWLLTGKRWPTMYVVRLVPTT